MINLEIDTYDKKLINEILGTNRIEIGTASKIHDDVTIIFHSAYFKKSFNIPDTYRFVIEIITAFSVSYFANWLYGKLNNRAEKIRINGEEININIDDIQISIRRLNKDRE